MQHYGGQTLKEVKQSAYKLGRRDAKQGRVYRHSADPGSWVRSFLDDYERGWQSVRQDTYTRI